MASTIYAAATPLVKSGVGIIRISGEQAAQVFSLFSLKQPPARMVSYQSICSPKDGSVIDQGLVLWLPGPHSFTGEDTVELQLHGSVAVMRAVLEHLSCLPQFRLAEPGEFSKRAFMNGKMDLVQAEGLADLIEAETNLQLRQAQRQMAGGLSSLYENWRSQMINIMALVEACVDFPEEDIPEDVVEQAYRRLGELVTEIEQHMQDGRRGETIRSGMEVVIYGAPNVGKSSLLNLLAKKDVAIVSDIAGTTRDMIEVHLDIHGLPFTLIDTAGMRESLDVIEQEGVSRAKKRAHQADWKIALFDATQLPALDEDTLSLVDERTTVLINKRDHYQGELGLREIKGRPAHFVSMKDSASLDPLFAEFQALADQYASYQDQPMITRLRYREALQTCVASLREFNFDKPIELAAEDLRYAASMIGRITGVIGVEDILDRVFSEFCIGK